MTDERTYQEQVLADVKEKTGITEYEVSIILKVLDKIKEPLPSTLSGAQNKVSAMDAMRPTLLNLIYYINNLCIKAEKSYYSRYSNEYRRINKTSNTRVTKDSVTAEILAKDDIAELKEKWDYLEQVKWLLVGYQKSFDQARLSTIERWHDNRRV